VHDGRPVPPGLTPATKDDAGGSAKCLACLKRAGNPERCTQTCETFITALDAE
jgi:hypothetical protein